jgi:uncharacterized membrane protein
MLLRRTYEVLALLILIFAVTCVIGGFYNAVNGGGFYALMLGVIVAAFSATIAFVIYKFASGPAQAGLRTLGIDEKAQIMKAESLKRKPAKVSAR